MTKDEYHAILINCNKSLQKYELRISRSGKFISKNRLYKTAIDLLHFKRLNGLSHIDFN